MSKKQWWHDGVRFECQGSGQCCVSRGEYGYVFMTLQDRRNMAKLLGLTTSAFTRKHCDRQGTAYHLKEDPKRAECQFLDKNRCKVYHARPIQCRTWPFWPEVMNAKTWAKEVASYCPGVGKGPVRSREDIEKQLAEQEKSEKELIQYDRML